MIYRLDFFALDYTKERKFTGKRHIGHTLITERLFKVALNHPRVIANEKGIKLPHSASCQTSEYVALNGKLTPETISYETLF